MTYFFEEAVNAFNQRDLVRAETIFRRILQETNNPESLYYLGQIALLRGANDEAINCFLNAHLSDKKQPDFIYFLALSLQESGRYEEAIKYYNKIKQNPMALNNLANIYRLSGKVQKARQAFEDAIKIDPDNPFLYVNKSILTKDLSDTEQALKINPDFAPAWAQKAILLREIDIKKALQSHEKSISLDGENSSFYISYGISLIQDKQFEKAIKQFDYAISIDPYNADAYYNRALAKNHLNQDPTLDYETALKCNPNHLEALTNLGAIYIQTNRLYDALTIYQDLLRKDPKNMKACFNLAGLLAQVNELDEAFGLYIYTLLNGIKESSPCLSKVILKIDDKKLAYQFLNAWITQFPDDIYAKKTADILSFK